MATFTGTTDADTANAGNGALIGFSGGTVSELQDGTGDTFFGGDGNDQIHAGAGGDILEGGLGNDTLDGGAGVDVLTGGLGHDNLRGGFGKDTLDGGAGIDLADYSDKTSSVSVTLNGSTNATVTVGGVAEDAIRNIEKVIGGSGADKLTGDSQANALLGGAGNDVLKGGLGNDTLDGGAGVDWADYGDKTSSVVVTLNGSSDAVMELEGVAEDTIRNIEKVRGGSGNDTLTGDGLANELGGGGGDDILTGGLGNDVLDGGAGDDLADYGDKTSSIVATLNGATEAEVTVGGVVEDTIRNIEKLGGGSGNDTLTGDTLANGLAGGAGNDIVKGGLGSDYLAGDAGVDLADYSDKTLDVVVTLNGPYFAPVSVDGVAEDFIRDFEKVLGGSGDDSLTGDALANGLAGGAGDDVLKGGLGNDTLDGGAGVDGADYVDKTSSVVVTLNGSTNAVVTVGGVAEDTIRNIELVRGGAGADKLTGDGLTNGMDGDAGDDVLKGGSGQDVLYGGEGVDLADYSDKTSSVVVALNGATVAEVTVGGVTEDYIYMFEKVLGGSGADTLTGDALANGLAGGGGNDILKGGLGNDALDGGAGADVADYRDKTSSVAVTLNGATNAIVTVGGVAEDAIRNIEHVFGGSGVDTLTGDGLANALVGGAGNDILKGGLGKDMLDGGAGADVADYRDKTSSVAVTLNGATNATVTVGGVAEDAIRNIEHVFGGSGVDTLTGDGLANALVGGAGNDILKGGLGKDLLDGGAGADVADYRDKTSSVVVTLNGSTNATVTVGGVAEDAIRNIEHVLGGSGADTIAGDSLANAFAGGAGADRFVYRSAFGKDTIVDFSSSDKLVIDDAIFADWASVLGAAQQVGSDTVITASAADTITLKNFAVGNLSQSQVQLI